jgi:hypothetical protein
MRMSRLSEKQVALVPSKRKRERRSPRSAARGDKRGDLSHMAQEVRGLMPSKMLRRVVAAINGGPQPVHLVRRFRFRVRTYKSVGASSGL